MKKTAIIFRTHKQDEITLAHLEKLESEVKDVFTVYDSTDKKPFEHKRAFNFSVEDARRAGYLIVDDKTIQALPYQKPAGANAFYYNCEYPTLLFFNICPIYDYYLTVEHDVWFNGNWNWFLKQLSENDGDLLATFPRFYPDEPFPGFWDTFNFSVPKEYRRGFFGPVIRYSKALLKMLNEEYKSGKHGHYEAVVPTLAAMHDFSFKDINDGREMLGKTDKYLLYDGSTFHSGKSFSPYWKLIVNMPRAKNMLFHPVYEQFYKNVA